MRLIADGDTKWNFTEECSLMTSAGTWQPLNQTGRHGTDEVVATAGNVSSKMLRVKAAGGAETEIPANQFQATAAGDYTQGWMDFLAQTSMQSTLQYKHNDWYGKEPV